jgi:hypothetical protein
MNIPDEISKTGDKGIESAPKSRRQANIKAVHTNIAAKAPIIPCSQCAGGGFHREGTIARRHFSHGSVDITSHHADTEVTEKEVQSDECIVMNNIALIPT